MSGCPLLATLRYAAFSSSASNRPPLALRVVACREAIRAGHGMQTGALLETRTRTAGYVGWPRTVRGASAGHSGRTGRNTIGRPSRASCRPPGTEKQSNQPLRRATWCHSPGWVAGKPFVSCRGRARLAPWTRKACVHSPSSLPPEPPIPPDWRCHPSCGPQLKFEGKGGLRAPCGKDYPPNPPLRSGQINWGVRGHGRPLH